VGKNKREGRGVFLRTTDWNIQRRGGEGGEGGRLLKKAVDSLSRL